MDLGAAAGIWQSPRMAKQGRRADVHSRAGTEGQRSSPTGVRAGEGRSSGGGGGGVGEPRRRRRRRSRGPPPPPRRLAPRPPGAARCCGTRAGTAPDSLGSGGERVSGLRSRPAAHPAAARPSTARVCCLGRREHVMRAAEPCAGRNGVPDTRAAHRSRGRRRSIDAGLGGRRGVGQAAGAQRRHRCRRWSSPCTAPGTRGGSAAPRRAARSARGRTRRRRCTGRPWPPGGARAASAARPPWAATRAG